MDKFLMDYDAIIIGAGAAGLFAAMHIGKKGKSVLVIDHAKKPAEKVRISGGGRCNFTNIKVNPENFLSKNSKFCISALRRYTPQDFIKLVEDHGIKYHEKTLGQLFCDNSSQEIIDMLMDECKKYGVKVDLGTSINSISKLSKNSFLQKQETIDSEFETEGLDSCLRKNDDEVLEGVDVDVFEVKNSKNQLLTTNNLIIATGGLSIPKMGATGFAYDIAKQFNIDVIEPEPALVPLIFSDELLEFCKDLTGIAVDTIVKFKKQIFKEAILFTHKGLSGPAILQISSYIDIGDTITINLCPDIDIFEYLKEKQKSNPKQELSNALSEIFPKRLGQKLAINYNNQLANISDKNLRKIASDINQWQVKPTGTRGFKIAEVTRGGVDTNELSSKTFECKKVKGLYFIGEAVDVTGHLGGYNFQWAWASAFCLAENL